MYYPMNYNETAYNMGYGRDFYQNVHPPNWNPCSINFNDGTLDISIEKRQEEEEHIESFLKKVDEDLEVNSIKCSKRSSKIGEAKNSLMMVFKMNKEIEDICTTLRCNTNTPEVEWQEKMERCATLKDQILETMKKFKDTNYCDQLKQDIKKRQKKRLREQVKKQNWKIEKARKMANRARLHAEADSWLRSKQAEIEKEKQEENLRKDADMILSDVRNKRNDAKKYSVILQELKNLRNVKTNIAKARGETLSAAANDVFNNIIDKLSEQWSALDREYSIEEQGLKLMLKTDNEQRIEKQKKNVFDEWQNVLFGRKVLTSDQPPPDIPNLVLTRTAWDKYISYDADASPIPIGWIIPKKPQSAAWQKCLKTDTS